MHEAFGKTPDYSQQSGGGWDYLDTSEDTPEKWDTLEIHTLTDPAQTLQEIQEALVSGAVVEIQSTTNDGDQRTTKATFSQLFRGESPFIDGAGIVQAAGAIINKKDIRPDSIFTIDFTVRKNEGGEDSVVTYGSFIKAIEAYSTDDSNLPAA